MPKMNKPSQEYPLSPTSKASNIAQNIQDFSLKGESWDQLLKNRGIRFIHRVSSPCPNMRNLEDMSHNPNCPICDGQGTLYYAEKEIFGVFYSNSLEKNYEMQGIWEMGSAVVTLPTEYEDGVQAEFNTWDQLVLPDFTVKLWEFREYTTTPSKTQGLRYDIKNIDTILGAQNNILVQYQEGVHFTIVNGVIQWIPGNTPPENEVLVIHYYANPVYNVLQHMRELRISQQFINGKKIAKRLPMQVLVKRDFFSRGPDKEE
jgi:hypothetical protein